MTSGTNSSESGLSSKKNSKIYDNYLKEMNEDLKLRKQEILEMLKPLEDKNNLLLQKVMANLEEKQKSLQIMRQIMAGRGCDESPVMELVTEPEERKQNLEKKNKMLQKEMEMLWDKTFESEELCEQQKSLPTKPKADMQDRKAQKSPLSLWKAKSEPETSDVDKVDDIRKEKQQTKIKYEEQPSILQNGFLDKVIELKTEALRKTNDFKSSLYLQHNFEPKQGALNLLRPQGKMGATTMERATINRNELDMAVSERGESEVRGSVDCGSQLGAAQGNLSLPERGLWSQRSPFCHPGSVLKPPLGSPVPSEELSPPRCRTGSGAAPPRAEPAGLRRRITDEAAGSAGDCFCLGPAEAAFVPRAHPHRVRPANPVLLARPGTFPGSHSRLGRRLPAPGTPQPSSHSSPHSPRVARLGV
ncbi:putative coiled-coil domain-containing protein 196 [Mus pahari]|uniref:putative coiled-coil domain-containing protein 196 n=1 Tax=Mus pahari TaxID=10093 RepID=UPI000A304D22|nr:putative coiled-coil domain-containing protein 196 [Mus pahari]